MPRSIEPTSLPLKRTTLRRNDGDGGRWLGFRYGVLVFLFYLYCKVKQAILVSETGCFTDQYSLFHFVK